MWTEVEKSPTTTAMKRLNIVASMTIPATQGLKMAKSAIIITSCADQISVWMILIYALGATKILIARDLISFVLPTKFAKK